MHVSSLAGLLMHPLFVSDAQTRSEKEGLESFRKKLKSFRPSLTIFESKRDTMELGADLSYIIRHKKEELNKLKDTKEDNETTLLRSFQKHRMQEVAIDSTQKTKNANVQKVVRWLPVPQ